MDDNIETDDRSGLNVTSKTKICDETNSTFHECITESAIENANEHSQVQSLITSIETSQTTKEHRILDVEEIFDVEQPDLSDIGHISCLNSNPTKILMFSLQVFLMRIGHPEMSQSV